MSITGFSLPASTCGQTARESSSATSDLNSAERGRSVEPVSVSRRCMILAMLISATAPRWTAIETWRPSSAQAFEVAGQIVAADHVEHDVDARAAGEPLHRLDEIVAVVVDRMGRAELLGACGIWRRCRR